jgi:enediyne polyketide synthase
MLERPALSHRADGKPELSSGRAAVSASHGAGVTLAVVGPERVGCDAEAVRELSQEDWRGLLDTDQFALAELIQRERGESLSVAATRVWGAVECLRKVGRAVPGAITLAQSYADGWVSLDSGHAKVATFATRLRDQADLTVFTVLTEGTTNGSVLRVPAHRWLRGDQPRR